MCFVHARPIGILVLFHELFERSIRENGELLVRRRGGKERAARVFARFCNALCLPHGFFADLEIKIVREKLVKLNTEQTALSQHAAALLDVVAEIRFERRVRDYDRFAEQSTDLRATDVEDIGKHAEIRECHVIFGSRQAVAETCAVNKEVQPAARADIVQGGQLRFGI